MLRSSECESSCQPQRGVLLCALLKLFFSDACTDCAPGTLHGAQLLSWLTKIRRKSMQLHKCFPVHAFSSACSMPSFRGRNGSTLQTFPESTVLKCMHSKHSFLPRADKNAFNNLILLSLSCHHRMRSVAYASTEFEAQATLDALQNSPGWKASKTVSRYWWDNWMSCKETWSCCYRQASEVDSGLLQSSPPLISI